MKGRQLQVGASELAELKYGWSFLEQKLENLDLLLVTGAVPVAVRDL
jgi:hypothetical protein